jgi:integral membrane protein
MNLLRTFRLFGILEGSSFLFLLLIAMPLKYWAGMPEYVMVGGWIHGILVIIYNILATIAWQKHHWPILMWFQAGVASLVPLGTFWFDRKLRN